MGKDPDTNEPSNGAGCALVVIVGVVVIIILVIMVIAWVN